MLGGISPSTHYIYLLGTDTQKIKNIVILSTILSLVFSSTWPGSLSIYEINILF